MFDMRLVLVLLIFVVIISCSGWILHILRHELVKCFFAQFNWCWIVGEGNTYNTIAVGQGLLL